MLNFDGLDAQHIAALDDTDLEICRLRMLRDGDQRAELVVERLIFRVLPTLTRVVREEGEKAGLPDASIRLAIEDAAARLMLRLTLREKLAPIKALAATVAADCVTAQDPKPEPKLVRRGPELRIVRNDWRNS